MKEHKFIYGIIIFFIVSYGLFHLIRSFSQSLFITHKDRVNFVIYGPYTAIYSLGMLDDQNYVIPFSPNFHLQVPGGYGQYRIGSLGKLATLDKNPELLKRAFSYAASTFVGDYFYDNTESLYYDVPDFKKGDIKLDTSKILFYKSNASFFDRLYLLLVISQKDKNNFKIFNSMSYNDQTEFAKNVLGLFYQKTFRDEKKNVQILYARNYYTTAMISDILEGSGIRVSDLTVDDQQSDIKNTCRVVERGSSFSQTASMIAMFFHCSLERGNPEVYDILFILGNTETSWEISSL